MTEEALKESSANSPKNTDSGVPERFSLYTIFPTSLFFRGDITDSEKMLYGLLSCMSDHRGYAFPRNATLQKYLGKDGKKASEDTVSRRLKALENVGAIRIEGGNGGRGIRKIFIVGVDFQNLRKSAEVGEENLRKSAEGIQIKNKKNKSNNKGKASEEEINDWISKWAISLGYERELTTGLISDFFAFAESRKAKGKPFLTIRAVSMQANKLTKTCCNASGHVEMIARMRYMLRSSITHNWEEVYPIDERTERDFKNWAYLEYGIGQKQQPAIREVEQW